jgi:hypothetical protein
MYLPDPLFALVLSHLTDGRPAERVLTRFDRSRPVKGWQPGWGPAWADGLLHRPGRDWGAVRRLIDTAVHLRLRTELAGDWHYFCLLCMPQDTNRVLRCLLGHWPAPPGIIQPHQLPVPDAFQKLVYNYGAVDETQVLIINATDVAMTGAETFPDDTTIFMMHECYTRGCPIPPCTTFII